jgi:D-tyrosyl-tRNA(Tyr) deacylase
MKAVVQRVSRANVTINGNLYNSINTGLVVFLGIAPNDNINNIVWMCNKIANLRIFNDENGKMNLSVIDIGGEILLISNFTLYADVQKGFRPGFTDAASPEIARPIYNKFIDYLKNNFPVNVKDGVFGAMMDIELVNVGPVTIDIERNV